MTPAAERNRIATVEILDRAIAHGAQLSFDQRNDEAAGPHWHARLRWTNGHGETQQVHALAPTQDEALRHLAINAMVHPDRGFLFGSGCGVTA